MITHVSNDDLMSNKSWRQLSEEKNRLPQDALGIVLVRMRLNLLELFELLELLLRVDVGTVKAHWVEIPRQ